MQSPTVGHNDCNQNTIIINRLSLYYYHFYYCCYYYYYDYDYYYDYLYFIVLFGGFLKCGYA